MLGTGVPQSKPLHGAAAVWVMTARVMPLSTSSWDSVSLATKTGYRMCAVAARDYADGPYEGGLDALP